MDAIVQAIQSLARTITAPITANNGWVTSFGTATYASATTITVSATDYANVDVGTKVWLVQSSNKYYYVIAKSGGNTLTLTGGIDYTVANATITSFYYSNVTNPVNFPHWFNYTPTFTGFSVNPTVGISQFRIIGHECYYILRTTANGTSNATGLSISAPVVAATLTNAFWWGIPGGSADNGVALTTPSRVYIASAGTTFTADKDYAGNVWTNVNAKGINFAIQYAV